MKTLLIAVVMTALMGVAVSYIDEIQSYLDNSAEVIVIDEEVIEEEPTMPSEWLESAEEAYEEVIRRKTLEAEKESLEAIVASSSKRIEGIDKELGLY